MIKIKILGIKFKRPFCKIGQGHPRVIILSNHNGLESLMLQTNFSGNRPTGSGEEEFRRVFTINGRGGHLGHVTKISDITIKIKILGIKFKSHYPRRLHKKFQLDRPSGF